MSSRCSPPLLAGRTCEHHRPASRIDPVAPHVQSWKGHVGGADLKRDQVIAKSADGERDDPQEDHDRAVHRTELVVELGQQHAAGAFVNQTTRRPGEQVSG